MENIMSSKLFTTRQCTVLLGVIAAVIAAIALLVYLNHYKSTVAKPNVDVLVAKRLILSGTTGAVIRTAGGYYTVTSVPSKQVKTGAILDPATLANQVANLDNYRPVVETTVHFGFDKADLTKKAKDALDKLAAEIPNTKGYIIALEGNTDSTGPEDYNYQLSQRRARAVIQYLAAQHQVPAHKIYLIGLGEDKPAAKNSSTEGRAENRRVEVRLMTNIIGGQQAQNPNQAPATAQQ